MRRGRGGFKDLRVDVSGSSGKSPSTDVPSFDIRDTCFIHKAIAFHSKGVEMKDSTKTFVVDPKELNLNVESSIRNVRRWIESL